MQVLHLAPGEPARRIEPPQRLPEAGFLWIDFVREETPDWPGYLAQLTGVEIHERHISDSLNPAHPSYADGTVDYEMIIFRGLKPHEGELGRFETRPLAFFLLPRVLVTIRPADSRSVVLVRERLLDGVGHPPDVPQALMHLLLNAMVDRFLHLREALDLRMEEWRDTLLQDDNTVMDWRALLAYRGQLRTLELRCEEQEDAITSWREFTDIEIDQQLAVRFNDVVEHVRRVNRFATDRQSEVESLVQLHFSAVAHRTNEIVKLLTLISAIFLPLSLIAGIFGMNFENMPELHTRYGYFVALAGMLLLALVLLWLFKRRRWL